jgi:hypothetical protein
MRIPQPIYPHLSRPRRLFWLVLVLALLALLAIVRPLAEGAGLG